MLLRLGDLGGESKKKKRQEKEDAELGKIRNGNFFPLNPILAQR